MFVKRSNKLVSFWVVATLLLGTGILSLAQGPQTYKAQLRIVPISGVQGRAAIDESATVFATANATGTLAGTKFTVRALSKALNPRRRSLRSGQAPRWEFAAPYSLTSPSTKPSRAHSRARSI